MSEKPTRTKTVKKPAAKAPAKTAAKKPAAKTQAKTSAKKPAAKTKAAPKTPKAPKKELLPVELTKMAALAAGQLAIEKKGTNVKLLDVREITSMTDFFIIASATSDIQVKAIADHILGEMREKHGVAPWKSEGWDTRKWIIVDYVDFVVHIFHEEARDFYALERLWADAPTELLADTALPKKRASKKKAVKA